MFLHDKTTAKSIIICILHLLLAGFLFSLPKEKSFWFLFAEILSYGIWYFFILFWMGSIRSRVLHRYVRYYLNLCGMIMFAWMILRQIRLWYPGSDAMGRFMGYVYFIPIILLPVYAFIASLYIGQSEKKYLPGSLLYVPATVLIALALTNDSHQTMISYGNGLENYKTEYQYELVYYLIIVWVYVLMLGAFVTLFLKCRNSVGRRHFAFPFFATLSGFALCMCAERVPGFWYGTPESFSLMMIIAFESCIQVGMIPVNVGYPERFKNLAIPAKIVNSDGVTKYETKSADMLIQPKTDDVFIETQKYAIPGGRIIWGVDVAGIRKIRSRLAEQKQILDNEQELIRSENDAKERTARAQEKNRLYHEIAVEVQEKVKKVQEILAACENRQTDAKEAISLAAIYTVHIKRRSNMMLLCRGAESVSLNELRLCMMESMNYLRLRGVTTSLSVKGECQVESENMLLMYELYEAAVESALNGLNGLMVFLSLEGEKVRLRIVISCPNSAFAENWKNGAFNFSTDHIELSEEDEMYYLSADFPKGGAFTC